MAMFEHILLEPVQEELLIKIVEASRNTPLEKRQRFDVVREKCGDSLAHPSIPKDNSQIYFGDVKILAGEGLVALSYGARGDVNFDVTSLGFKRQEHGGQKEGRPLTWEDARRVVFQTLIVMYEIDRAL
jgi:hypothetical protein